jgi:hypothetical protein
MADSACAQKPSPWYQSGPLQLFNPTFYEKMVGAGQYNVGDFWKGALNGVAGLIGLGKQTDPLAQKKKELSTANSHLRSMIDTSTLTALKDINGDFEQMLTLMNQVKQDISVQQEYDNELLTEGLQEENIFTSLLAVLVVVIVLYLLFDRDCC